MVETITPAGCGSRTRQILALSIFTAAATAAGAAAGALLGAAGGLIDLPAAALAIVVGLALLSAVREALPQRLGVPQIARQVPERWRRERSLPVWSAGYGAGLGLGALTHQVTGLFWVLAAAVVVIGDASLGALALGLHGAGRAFAPLLATGRREPAETVARLIRARPRMVAVNVLALAGLALVLAGPAAAQAGVPAEPPPDSPVGTGSIDPAVSGPVVARTTMGEGLSAVVVTSPGAAAVTVEGARHPSLDGPLLAYATDGGIEVVRWASAEPVAQVAGDVRRPALAWPWLAYLRRDRRQTSLVLANLDRGSRRVIARAGRIDDLGRPALGGGRLAYHLTTARGSVLIVRPLRRLGELRVVASSRVSLHVNPSLTSSHVAWVEQNATTSLLQLRAIEGSRVRTLARVSGGDRIFWTTALGPRRVYVSRWALAARRAEIISRAWR